MSRSNPFKGKKRKASKTLLVFGEGLSEEVFLRYLKSLFSFNSGVSIMIKKGRGGSVDGIVINASKIPGDFDRKIVVFDNDKSKAEMEKARQEAKNRSIEIVENTPCLESVLISILDKKPSRKDSAWCKHEFESKYLDKKKRGEQGEYMRLFPKKLLESKRSEIQELNKLISIMEGK